MAQERKKASIVGIVADVHRHMEGHHYSQWSSVFGISEEEFNALQQSVERCIFLLNLNRHSQVGNGY